MKVTSLDISKKLAEIGFNKKAGFLDYYYNTEGHLRNKHQEKYYKEENTDVDYFSYDLETILDALPKKIRMDGDTKELILNIANSELSYTSEDYCYYIMSPNGTYPDWLPEDIIVFRNKDESLADTAARLLIKLYEVGLIKFNEE